MRRSRSKQLSLDRFTLAFVHGIFEYLTPLIRRPQWKEHQHFFPDISSGKTVVMIFLSCWFTVSRKHCFFSNPNIPQQALQVNYCDSSGPLGFPHPLQASMEGLRKKCLAGFTEALQIGGESTTFQGGRMPVLIASVLMVKNLPSLKLT